MTYKEAFKYLRVLSTSLPGLVVDCTDDEDLDGQPTEGVEEEEMSLSTTNPRNCEPNCSSASTGRRRNPNRNSAASGRADEGESGRDDEGESGRDDEGEPVLRIKPSYLASGRANRGKIFFRPNEGKALRPRGKNLNYRPELSSDSSPPLTHAAKHAAKAKAKAASKGGKTAHAKRAKLSDVGSRDSFEGEDTDLEDESSGDGSNYRDTGTPKDQDYSESSEDGTPDASSTSEGDN